MQKTGDTEFYPQKIGNLQQVLNMCLDTFRPRPMCEPSDCVILDRPIHNEAHKPML